MTISEYISQRLNDAVVGIQANMQAKNINASGRTSQSFHVAEVETGKHWQLVGGGQNCAPIGTIEVGRPAGRVPYDFASIIYDWGVAKGLSGWSIKSANAVAWKIRTQGTERHYKNEDVYSTVVTTAETDIKNEVAKLAQAEVKSTLSELIHNFNKT